MMTITVSSSLHHCLAFWWSMVFLICWPTICSSSELSQAQAHPAINIMISTLNINFSGMSDCWRMIKVEFSPSEDLNMSMSRVCLQAISWSSLLLFSFEKPCSWIVYGRHSIFVLVYRSGLKLFGSILITTKVPELAFSSLVCFSWKCIHYNVWSNPGILMNPI